MIINKKAVLIEYHLHDILKFNKFIINKKLIKLIFLLLSIDRAFTVHLCNRKHNNQTSFSLLFHARFLSLELISGHLLLTFSSSYQTLIHTHKHTYIERDVIINDSFNCILERGEKIIQNNH